MVAELVSTILQLIKDINSHIDDYKCDDILIDNIFFKIISIQPHIENLTDLNDTVTSQNCQRLHVLICKIKKEIREYKDKTGFKKFFSINKLKSKCVEFNNEIDTIFKNLKFNFILKNNKNSDNLIIFKQEEMDYLKQSLNAKCISNDIKKDLIGDIVIINQKVECIIDYISKSSNSDNYKEVINMLTENIQIFNNSFIKITKILNNIDKNVSIIANSILKKRNYFYYNLFLSLLIFWFGYYIYNYIEYIYTDNKVYT